MSGKLFIRSTEENSDDEFDDFDMQEKSSKLANLFSSGEAKTGQPNSSSLVYKAPKQNPEKTVTEDQNAKVKVLFAVAVHVFLLENEKFVPHGKLGLAILGDKCFKILIYLANKQPVCQLPVQKDTVITVHPHNYVQFTDDQQKIWSLCFEDDSQITDFFKWILTCKSCLGEKNLHIIDVNDGDGRSVNNGDCVQIELTEFLISDGPQMILQSKNDALKVQIGQGNVSEDVEKCLIGMKKHSKRILLPICNESKIFVVTIKRVKYANLDKSEEPQEIENKAEILSRISKIGHSIINENKTTEKISHSSPIEAVAVEKTCEETISDEKRPKNCTACDCCENLQSLVESLQKQNEKLKIQLDTFITTTNEKLQTIEKQLDFKEKSDYEMITVKKIMNHVYKKVSGQLQDDQTYSGNEIKQILADTIKECTLRIVTETEK